MWCGHDSLILVLRRRGAVAATGIDAGVAAHYGDPLREGRVLAEAAGVVDRGNRGILAVSGTDRLSWLHSLTSQHLSELGAGRGTEALVLSPHGHVEHHLLVAHIADTVWLDLEPGTTDALRQFLDSMRFMLRVEVSDEAGAFGMLSVVGPEVAQALARLGVVPDQPYDVAELPDGGWIRRMPWPGSDAADLCVPRDRVEAIVDQLDVPPCGSAAFEALRVQSRRARLNVDTDHRTLAPEAGWLEPAVHLDKGCYRGQETVARVHNLGRPPRRLVLVHLDGTTETLPSAGTPVTLDGRRIGFVGTAVRHFELGPIALAMVRRAVDDQADLRVGADGDEQIAARIDID